MPYCDRIDIFGGIDISKTSASKECDICCNWFFLDNAFKFERHVCNGCHYLFMMSISVNGIAVLSIHGANYGCIINGISKNDVLNLLKIFRFYRQERNIMKVKNYNKFITIYKTGK